MSDDQQDTTPTSDSGSQLAQLTDLHGQGMFADNEFGPAKRHQ